MMMKRLLNARVIDVCLIVFCIAFMGCMVFINLYLSNNLAHKQELVEISKVAARENEKTVQEILPSAPKRVRRQAGTYYGNYSSWTLPTGGDPIILGVPLSGCPTENVLSSDFPNGTCYASCASASCSGDDIANIQDGSANLVCTARVVQLGFKRTGAYTISRWVKAHSNVRSRTGLMFENDYASCPAPQLEDTASTYYLTPYTTDQIGGNQENLYIHCEECLTVAITDAYFGSVFLDLPTALFGYFASPDQKYIVTLKNPTDRAIAEYFYPYISDGTDLTTVGSDVLHAAMEAAITQAKNCMNSIGVAACVYGIQEDSAVSGVLAETTMLYESCYSTRLNQIIQQIDQSQIYFMMYEEYSATPEAQIQDLFSFIGLDYEGPINLPGGTPVHKPINTATINMMDAFFAPFNAELVSLLGDSKWAFTRA